MMVKRIEEILETKVLTNELLTKFKGFVIIINVCTLPLVDVQNIELWMKCYSIVRKCIFNKELVHKKKKSKHV